MHFRGTYHSSSHTNYHSSAHSTHHSSIHTSYHSASSAGGASGHYTTSTTGFYTTSTGQFTSGGVGSSPECQYQKQLLQATYIKAYIELTRLLAEYEQLIHTHNCEDWVYESEGQREKALREKQVVLVQTITSWEAKMHAYKVRLEEAYHAEFRLRTHIQSLTARCKEMDATVSSLDKVRDAIHIIGACPGLGTIEFRVPKWTGVWKKAFFDTISHPNAAIDEEMNALCNSDLVDAGASSENPSLLDSQSRRTSPGGSQLPNLGRIRAAEASEITLRSIEGMPSTNTAGAPLFGTCPHCDGDPDDPEGEQHASGHSRVCWQDDAYLDMNSRNTDCSAGKKAVLCVEDYGFPGMPPPIVAEAAGQLSLQPSQLQQAR